MSPLLCKVFIFFKPIESQFFFQGWRATMEDSHIDYVDEKNDTYIFGVFDGHGGNFFPLYP